MISFASSRGMVQVRKVWFYFYFYSTANWSKKFSLGSQNATVQFITLIPCWCDAAQDITEELSCCELLSQGTAELKHTLILLLHLLKMRRLRPWKKLFLLRHFLGQARDNTSLADSNLNREYKPLVLAVMDLKSLAGETQLQKAVTGLGERINLSPFWQSNKPQLSNQ